MSLELAFELYPEIYEQLFQYGKELANIAKETRS